ncbi:MAG: hypothetical protein KDA32_09000 [Phycisphaerales bacterium]|nr:hypothetical protein [Phycisphaerales bacterium]
MWIDGLLNSRVTHAVELSARFAEERQAVLAENIANIDTPDYHTRQLDANGFQSALRKAFESAEKGDARQLRFRTDQVRVDDAGSMSITPTTDSAPNLLFHDGTNARLEDLMTDAQSNWLDYSLTTTLLRNRWSGLMNAIRGRTQ